MLSRKSSKNYAYILVSEGKICFNQLNDIEKEKLTGLLLESTPMIHAYEYISEADLKCEIPYMLGKLLETGNEDMSKSIIEKLKNNAITYMSRSIDEILSEQEQEYNFNKKENYYE